MVSVKEQMRALLDMNRKKDVPSTVAPMWRVVKCMDEGTFFSSIWQEMVSVHGQCGSSMVVHKAQFDVFFNKVQPTMVELQISLLRWVRLYQPSIGSCCKFVIIVCR